MTDLADAPATHGRIEPMSEDATRPALSLDQLRACGERPALILPLGAEGSTISYADLADRVERRRVELGLRRRLVAVAGATDIDTIVTILAALAGRHPLMIAERGPSIDRIVKRYAPDTLVSCDPGGAQISHPTDHALGSQHCLHPDLALLMSTSGTTGSPKMVRLSDRAVRSNAVAIAQALELSHQDRAITTLPLHYCFGLSVITSHLAVGASIVLDDHAVVDPCFWGAVERWDVTTLAGVPYTFEMIERSGIDALRLPSLRLVTQAGGRMAPDAVQRFSDLGAEGGWGFSVMYGQTEATARMAVCSPSDVRRHPQSVGHAIPGGSFRIAATGEVVYSGPNVMMGYARDPSDLGRGQELTELCTGDLGRLDDEGRLELFGRASRFVKIHGKRVDLDDIEQRLSGDERVRVAGDDEGIVVVTEGSGRADRLDDDLQTRVLRVTEIPAARVVAAHVREVPRTSSGKVDDVALTEVVRNLVSATSSDSTDASVADAFSLVLGLDSVDPNASFADLGGDSFSYVEMSIRLERVLGDLPSDWHLTPIGDLERCGRDEVVAPSFWTRIDTSVALRAIAILLIVCTHMRLFRLAGGAHALLAVAGYNLARFQLTASDVPGRFRRSMASISRVAVPTTAWIGLNMLLVGGYSLGAVLLVNNYTGDAARRGGRWEYWYFEAFVQIMVVVAIAFAIPAVRRAERRAPFVFALAVLAATLFVRFDVVQWGGEYNEMFRTHTVVCFLALGWCAQRASSTGQRLLVTALALLTTFGYFGQFDRELRIAVMIAALVWLPTVTVPRPLAQLIAPVAAASMWIFLIHWQVWPVFTPWMHNGIAFWLTIASGVGVWWVSKWMGGVFASRKRRSIDPRSTASVPLAPARDSDNRSEPLVSA